MRENQQAYINRFVDACQHDERVIAAFLGGSHARGEADGHSDLDLCVITSDDAYEEFVVHRQGFLQRLGELVFFEVFGQPEIVFYIYADGVEGELYFGQEGGLDRLHSGPFKVLLDKKGLLAWHSFQQELTNAADQLGTLRALIAVFWHELSHFITAMGRGQSWWAFGQLESLRGILVGLLRLQYDFSSDAGGDEPYFKIENEIPVELLTPLLETCVPRERQAMYVAVKTIVELYREHAPRLAEAHGIHYPIALERVMMSRFQEIES